MTKEEQVENCLELRDKPCIGEEIEKFVQHINALEKNFSDVTMITWISVKAAESRFNRFAKKYGKALEKKQESIEYRFESPYNTTAHKLNKAFGQAVASSNIIPQVFIMALVSQFDAFLGRIIRACYLIKPELMASSDRSLKLQQLIEIGSIDGAIEFLLEKEVESVLRLSHSEQFSWLENKFKLTLRKELASWPTFIELTERRNLFAHTDGVVSDQYISVCNLNKVPLPGNCLRGSLLNVSPEYFRTAYECIFEIGVKLAHVLWRKLLPDQLEEADGRLNSVAYDLITTEDYPMACNLLYFACNTLKKHGTEESRLILLINMAQAYKWNNMLEKCRQTLLGQDWSACGLQFHLAVAVLEDDFSQAASLMKNIGVSGPVEEMNYQEWPLFKEFRLSNEFLEAYENIYQKQFISVGETFKIEEEKHLRNGVAQFVKILEDKFGDLIDPSDPDKSIIKLIISDVDADSEE